MNKREQLRLVKAMSKITTEGEKYNRQTGKYEPAMVMPTLILDRDESNQVMLSAEDGGYFADYYGEFRGGYPWIDPRVEKAAERLGFYWEWENAAVLTAYES
ncbi:MAG: hypothetical protein ACC642_10880 [Pseudomonadales bacterium]